MIADPRYERALTLYNTALNLAPPLLVADARFREALWRHVMKRAGVEEPRRLH